MSTLSLHRARTTRAGASIKDWTSKAPKSTREGSCRSIPNLAEGDALLGLIFHGAASAGAGARASREQSSCIPTTRKRCSTTA